MIVGSDTLRVISDKAAMVISVALDPDDGLIQTNAPETKADNDLVATRPFRPEVAGWTRVAPTMIAEYSA